MAELKESLDWLAHHACMRQLKHAEHALLAANGIRTACSDTAILCSDVRHSMMSGALLIHGSARVHAPQCPGAFHMQILQEGEHARRSLWHLTKRKLLGSSPRRPLDVERLVAHEAQGTDDEDHIDDPDAEH